MNTYEPHELLVCRLAAEIQGRDLVVLGSFTPLAYAAYMLAKITHAPNAYIVGYDAVGIQPFRLTFTASEAAAYKGAVCRWGSLTEVNAIHLGGLGDIEAVSSAQLDGSGAINLSVIGDYERPKVRLPGGAGAPEVIKMYRTMVVYIPEHSTRTLVHKVDFATGRRWKIGPEARREAGLTPGPIILITGLGVLVKEDDDAPFRLQSVHPGVDPDALVEATGFSVEVPDLVPTTAEPTPQQLALLRERVDPAGTARFDFLGARKRREYLRRLLQEEWAWAESRIGPEAGAGAAGQDVGHG